MKKIVRLTESDLTNIIKRVINEQKNDDVLKVQQSLNKVWKNVKIKEDGIMGPETTNTIKRYQKENGMKETGVIDDELKNRLFQLLTNTPKGKGDKGKIIEVFRNHLNYMENDPRFTALGVAQTMYNDSAHFMNKTSLFSGREGEPTQTKAPFAPKS